MACKVIDLRKLTPTLKDQACQLEQPAPAEDVDNKVQACRVKAWGDQKKREIGIDAKLKMYLREIEILSTINHVS